MRLGLVVSTRSSIFLLFVGSVTSWSSAQFLTVSHSDWDGRCDDIQDNVLQSISGMLKSPQRMT